MQIAVIGLDLAKNVFQVHGIDDSGQAAVKRKLRRSEVLPFFAELDAALVGIEACHTAHYWGREIAALGHDVRLMPPQFVKPYVKSQKNDAADASAIAEAVQRPTMRFVPIKSADQQAVLMLHRTRDLLIRQRSSLISHSCAFCRIRHRGWTRHPQCRRAAWSSRNGRRSAPTGARGGNARHFGHAAARRRRTGQGSRSKTVGMASGRRDKPPLAKCPWPWTDLRQAR
jgi:hypothetical protein